MKIKMISLLLALLPAAAVSAPAPEQGEITQYFDPAAKLFLTIDQVQETVDAADIVYVGETHDQLACHTVQLKTIMELNSVRPGKVAVGFEMLNSTLQPILDDYSAGKIDDATFLEKTNWQKEWGFDFKIYEPIFSYIRRNNLKALALNVPHKIVSKTARGGLESLTPEEKKLVAKKVKINKDKKYTAFLGESYGGHGDNPMAKIIKWDNYVLSMAVWNESMGEKIADFMNANKGWSFVLVAGNGHIMYNAAIPWSVAKRTKKLKTVSIYTEDIAKRNEFAKNPDPVADIVWFVPFEKKEEPESVMPDKMPVSTGSAKVEVSTAAK